MDLEQRILKYIFAQIGENERRDPRAVGRERPNRRSRSTESLDIRPRRGKEIVSERLGHKVFEINPEGERLLCDWALGEARDRCGLRQRVPAQEAPLLHLSPRPEDDELRSALSRARDHHRRAADQRVSRCSSRPCRSSASRSRAWATILTIFKYGCPPHGGFAIGLERLTQKILGLSNVKEASLFPARPPSREAVALRRAISPKR